ncbi:hypothetical protein AAFF_G00080290 [Aldrovandia affinis]|uniref:Uncharacterized protein n=1 Tax=Aldrovandia affinis TaxID=143900 RepID=A0AAD7T349_9TELE|nr:hypothetical protein AAFF_G00080290 [Aldrovandia affinis]
MWLIWKGTLGVLFLLQGHVRRQLGLTSTEALAELRCQLASTLEQFKRKRRPEDTWQAGLGICGPQGRRRPLETAWQRSFLHHSVHWSSLHWPSALLKLLCALALLGCHALCLPLPFNTSPQFSPLSLVFVCVMWAWLPSSAFYGSLLIS